MAAPKFIDVAYAAEMLHVSRDAILDMVRSGGLKPYGGRAPNYFFRSADVDGLVTELGVKPEEQSPKRIKSASARVQARLTADARWAEVAAPEIREWVAHAEPARREAARKSAITARERLDVVIQLLDEAEPLP